MSNAEALHRDPLGRRAEELLTEDDDTVTDFLGDAAEIDELHDEEPSGATTDSPEAEASDSEAPGAEQRAEPEQEESETAEAGAAEDGAPNEDGPAGAKRSRFKAWKLSELA
jgi:hypothetical protein